MFKILLTKNGYGSDIHSVEIQLKYSDKKMKEKQRTVKQVKLLKNGVGVIHLFFYFEEGDTWSIPHLNEGFNFEILDYFLGNGEDLNTFVGKVITLKHEDQRSDLQNGIISFDEIEINVDEIMDSLAKKYKKTQQSLEVIDKLKEVIQLGIQ